LFGYACFTVCVAAAAYMS